MNYNFKIINYEFRIPVAKVLNKLIYTNNCINHVNQELKLTPSYMVMS